MTSQYEGLLNTTIDHLQRLRSRGFRFTHEPNIEWAKATYQRLSNPLARFIQEACETTHEYGDYVYKYEFHDLLNEWLRTHGFMTMTPERIGKGMKELGIEEGKRTSPAGNKQYRAYVGLKITENPGKAPYPGTSKPFTRKDKEKVVKYPDYPDTPDIETGGDMANEHRDCHLDPAECGQHSMVFHPQTRQLKRFCKSWEIFCPQTKDNKREMERGRV